MRTSAKLLILFGSVGALVAANEWHRSRERVKLAEAYADAVAQSVLPERAADDLFPATIQAVMIRISDHELSAISDRPARATEAAKHFLRMYVPVAELLPLVCKKHGVEISPFAQVYVALHADALAHAKASLTPIEIEKASAQWRLGDAGVVAIEAHVQEWSQSLEGGTVASACRELVVGGADLAAQANLAVHAPRVYGSLFGVTRP